MILQGSGVRTPVPSRGSAHESGNKHVQPMVYSFVSTAPPYTGMGGDNDFLKGEAPLQSPHFGDKWVVIALLFYPALRDMTKSGGMQLSNDSAISHKAFSFLSSISKSLCITFHFLNIKLIF